MNVKTEKPLPQIHPTQWDIILELSYHDTARFNEIKPLEMDPNQFTYHLKKLVDMGLVRHDADKGSYELTSKGISLIEKYKGFPQFDNIQITTYGLLYIRRDGLILTAERDSAPYKGYIGILSFDFDREDHMLVSAEKNLHEVGLSGEVSLPLMIEVLYRENNAVRTHALMPTFFVENPIGTPTKRNWEGSLSWYTVEALQNATPGYDNTKDLIDFFESEISRPQGITFLQRNYNTPIK